VACNGSQILVGNLGQELRKKDRTTFMKNSQRFRSRLGYRKTSLGYVNFISQRDRALAKVIHPIKFESRLILRDVLN
jgi:phosphopentomutase